MNISLEQSRGGNNKSQIHDTSQKMAGITELGLEIPKLRSEELKKAQSLN